MYLLLKRIKISVDVWLRVSCQEICRCLFASSESIPPLSVMDITHVDLGNINGNKAQPALDRDRQQPPQVSRATWSVFCFVDLTKPRNSSSETARMNRALQQELRNAPSLKRVVFFPHSIAEKLRKDTA